MQNDYVIVAHLPCIALIKESMMNVIFHLNQLERFDHCYANIKNLRTESIGIVELLINGDAIQLLIRDDVSKITDLLNHGTKISVCANSLRAHGIDSSILPQGVVIVPTGVFELIKKQNEGFSYIKP